MRVLPKICSNFKEWTIVGNVSNGTFHDLFSSGYLETVWSQVARVQFGALIASVLLVKPVAGGVLFNGRPDDQFSQAP